MSVCRTAAPAAETATEEQPAIEPRRTSGTMGLAGWRLTSCARADLNYFPALRTKVPQLEVSIRQANDFLSGVDVVHEHGRRREVAVLVRFSKALPSPP